MFRRHKFDVWRGKESDVYWNFIALQTILSAYFLIPFTKQQLNNFCILRQRKT